jgi:hypothetical protein
MFFVVILWVEPYSHTFNLCAKLLRHQLDLILYKYF